MTTDAQQVEADAVSAKVPHPAKFSEHVVTMMRHAIVMHIHPDRLDILDPFGGVGGIHQLADEGRISTYCIELEPGAGQARGITSSWST